MLSDSRYALRQLRKNPALSAVAVLTLALGISAATAIFSVVYGVLLRPLPYRDPDRIVAVQEISTRGRPMRVADPNFADFRDQGRSFRAIAKYGDSDASVSGALVPTRTRIARVSPGLVEGGRARPARRAASARAGSSSRRRRRSRSCSSSERGSSVAA